MLTDNIKKLLIQKRITAKELAKMVEVTPTHISYILNNKRDPSIELLNKIAAALGVSIEEIFEDKNFKDTHISNKDNSDTEKRHQIDTIAAHLEEKNLTPHKLKLLNAYIDALFSEEF